MNIFLLQAEHPTVPGIIAKAFATEAAATDEAMALVNKMLADTGRAQFAHASNWHSKLEELQEEHGAEHCWVEVQRLPVLNTVNADSLEEAIEQVDSGAIDTPDFEDEGWQTGWTLRSESCDHAGSSVETLDEAKSLFADAPSAETASIYVKIARTYADDEMIEEGTYAAILEEVSTFLIPATDGDPTASQHLSN